jgi:hypothetical protein
MATRSAKLELELLVHLVDAGYDRKAWHGPNLKSTVRRLTVAQAVWRPNPKRHNIAEIVVHAAYWKYAVRRRLRGDRRGSFAHKGSNWFPLPNTIGDSTWRDCLTLLDDEHRTLRRAVAQFPAARLHDIPAGSKVTYATLIYGVANHDVYHAGQIQLIKRLQAADA